MKRKLRKNLWLDNVVSVFNTNSAGICPICNSKKTDYGFIIINSDTNMGYGAIWCNECKNGHYMSRVQISNDMKLQYPPENLIFN